MKKIIEFIKKPIVWIVGAIICIAVAIVTWIFKRK